MSSESTPMKVLVIGGGYAGVMAALRVAGKAKKRRIAVAVTLVNGAPSFVERVRLHELGAGRPLRRIDLSHLLRGSGVELVVGWAVGIEHEARLVEVQEASGARRVAFDLLIDTTGSRVVDTLPGAREHGFAVGEERRARRLARRLDRARPGERVVVVGGGLTAIETANGIAESHPHLEVLLATAGRLGADLSEAGRAYLLRALDELGVRLREGTRAVEVQADGLLVRTLGLSAAARIEASIVVMATGFRASALAERSGLPTTAEGRVVVDDHLRVVGHPSIWAAGDAAAAMGADGALRMSCATAMPQAAHVADDVVATLAGEAHDAFRFGFLVRCISLGRRRGLVQWVNDRDEARETVLTGRIGAWFKEAVVRFTVLALRLERLFPGGYRWPRPSAAPPALPARASR
jgi:NADH:ubiquinone reductase (H+-translocating)